MILFKMGKLSMKRSEIKSSTDLFFYKGSVDFRAAELLYSSMTTEDTDFDPEIVLFHLQQAVEKSLKALLSNKSIRIKNSHNLTALKNLCEENSIILPKYINRLLRLTDFAVDGRYSLIHDDVYMCEELLPLTQDLLLFVENRLGITNEKK